MNTAEIEYQAKLINGKLEFIEIDGKENVKQFKKELQDGEKFTVKYLKGEKLDIAKTMRYYRSGVLGSFVPENFQTTDEAHEFFANKFLSRIDLINILDPEKDKRLHYVMKNSSQSIKSRFTEKLIYKGSQLEEIRLQINWVKSTSMLTLKQFCDYIMNIIAYGAEQGIDVLDSKLFKEQNAK